MNNSDQIGSTGEDELIVLLKKAGFIVNKTNHDQAGWDIKVEYREILPNSIKEIHDCKAMFTIQIKSTISKGRSWKIPLLNAYRFATYHHPSFYILLDYNSMQELVGIFILHVDEELINKILKEAAQNILDPQKKKIPLHFAKKHLISEISPTNIKKILQGYVGESFSTYCETKADILKSAGFEEGYGHINLEFLNREEIKNFVYLYLGLITEIPLNKAKMIQQRFGLDFLMRNSLQGAKLSMTAVPQQQGTLQVFKQNWPTSIYFSVNFYIFPDINLPDEFQLNRFQSDYFDFLVNFKTNRSELKFKLDTKDPINIGDFIKSATLYNLLSGKQEFEIIYIMGDKKHTFGHISSPHEQKLIHLLPFECFNIIKKFYDIPDKFKPTIEEIFKIKNELIAASQLISKNNLKLKVPIEHRPAPNIIHKIIISVKFQFDSLQLGILCVGNCEPSDIRNNEVAFIDKIDVKELKEYISFTNMNNFEELRATYRDKVVVNLGNETLIDVSIEDGKQELKFFKKS